mmetsp:Transcript_6719/g.12007  ORF Transcript_6719/g.12007 Transcript_6719/m.12007 type:complete len:158 (-) Transcript_6719:631-1104(-)
MVDVDVVRRRASVVDRCMKVIEKRMGRKDAKKNNSKIDLKDFVPGKNGYRILHAKRRRWKRIYSSILVGNEEESAANNPECSIQAWNGNGSESSETLTHVSKPSKPNDDVVNQPKTPIKQDQVMAAPSSRESLMSHALSDETLPSCVKNRLLNYANL